MVNEKVRYDKNRGPNYEIAEQLVKAGVVVMPEMVYCDKVKPITEAEFMKLHWSKIGCAHQKDQHCECQCHTFTQSRESKEGEA